MPITTGDRILDDLPRTLFPTTTDRFMATHGQKFLAEYNSKLLAHPDRDHAFPPQQAVYAAKPHHHLRRTVKLDPAAQWFLYDLVRRNSAALKPVKRLNKLAFGFAFKGGRPVRGRRAYKDYRDTVYESRRTFQHELQFDIASYLNTIYHHDLINWFGNVAKVEQDEALLGRFLREANSSRSIDCLPQGIYPAKMLGNAYLELIDSSSRIQSARVVRFMDDFHLFDDEPDVLLNDFYFMQELLGDRGLSVNAAKTVLPSGSAREFTEGWMRRSSNCFVFVATSATSMTMMPTMTRTRNSSSFRKSTENT